MTITSKQELCTMLSDIIKVSNLTVKELTEGTASVEQATELALNKLALAIVDTAIVNQTEMKKVFKAYSTYTEEGVFTYVNYLRETFDIAKLEEKTDEEIISLLTRVQRFKTNFALLYAMDSGYARNQQLLESYRWITQNAFYKIEDEAIKRKLVKSDAERFDWTTL